ncbi:acetoacetate--CoA ligase [Actinocorallia sp. API 0066]|uniref:acetoacetate--CoA ligase n=1 Tax=Actinocorallia sp. API 0066 TaxID=2896846 RepID=UPI001E35C9CC|nr:acetoacetate--CoA ligase [Actinocorallia sp. API 0066]MCD0449985.1 acetoacetate--CoA ligase [Actinocorallia sp. API 0066]
MDEGAALWEPSAGTIERARITAFRRDLGLPADYAGLWRWSVADVDGFWDTVWRWFDVVGDRGDGPVREGGPTPVDGLRWFPSARLNYAENALRHAVSRPDEPAVVYRTDGAPGAVLTWSELAAAVAGARAGLAALGVGRGDRVVGYVPNRPEALVVMLAAASLGAAWSSCSPDFGAASVVDRFRQIEPKVLLAVDGYRYGAKSFDRRDVVAQIRAELPSLEATVVIPVLRDGVPDGTVPYADLARPGPLEFARVPFDQPLWILYSSGTTGLPKPIVHGHGGMVLEHLKSLALHQDIGPGDVFLWFTTTGWMMWNYLVSGLMAGATIVVFDGAPVGDTLWRMAAETGTTHLGLGAPYIMASRKAGLTPGADLDLAALRLIGSTGSPLPPEGFDWVYGHVKRDVLLGSLSGGTDVCTGFVGPVPLLPVRAGVIQCRALGAAVEAYDESGEPLIDEVGELVLTEPMPCMPVGFWNDPERARYREAYFEDFPGVWRHGDWVKILPDGGCVIYGRSDSTLNRGGVRMGTSDFYRVVEAFPEIADSLVIDTGRLGEEGRLLLYVQLAPGAALDDALLGRLKAALRADLSPRHVPDEVIVVPGIPRTLSGKKLEVPVRKILQGADPALAANRDSLADPALLDHFVPDEPNSSA